MKRKHKEPTMAAFALTPPTKHGILTLSWRDHEASAPYSSERWAATDRGWFHGAIKGADVKVALGSYLYYPDREGPAIHAVCSVGKASAWFDDILAARDWIERTANESGTVEYMLKSLLSRGEIRQVQADEIRKAVRA
jgi:hypothetical protein